MIWNLKTYICSISGVIRNCNDKSMVAIDVRVSQKQWLLFCIISLMLVSIPTALAQSTDDTFRGIQIRPENRCSPYNRRDYSYPQSVEPEITVQQGGLFSPYDMRCFVSLRQVDIEHIVARSEAHDSGLCAATDQVRRAFSEDLLNLTHATRLLNGHIKGSNDAGEWLPQYNRCWYAHTIVAVKRKYGLTVDREEADALSNTLQNCPSKTMLRPTCLDSTPNLSASN